MPIRDFPFISIGGGVAAPWLPVRIINPHTNLDSYTYGLIDTGADGCCIPSAYAAILGHTLKKGTPNCCNTGNGKATAYSHTTKIEIYNNSDVLVYTIDKTCIDFMVRLPVVLLGVKRFLDNFKLYIDYPAKKFSITL